MAGIELAEADFALLTAPPRVTAELPGIGGRLRARPEDFNVREVPSYGADGTADAHLLLTLRKRLLTTEDAVREIVDGTSIYAIQFK